MFHILGGILLIVLGLGWSALALYAPMMSDDPEEPVDRTVWLGLLGVVLGVLAIWWP